MQHLGFQGIVTLAVIVCGGRSGIARADYGGGAARSQSPPGGTTRRGRVGAPAHILRSWRPNALSARTHGSSARPAPRTAGSRARTSRKRHQKTCCLGRQALFIRSRKARSGSVAVVRRGRPESSGRRSMPRAYTAEGSPSLADLAPDEELAAGCPKGSAVEPQEGRRNPRAGRSAREGFVSRQW